MLLSFTLKFCDEEYTTQSVTLNWKCKSKFYGHCLLLFCFRHPILAGEIFHDWLKHYRYTRCTKTPFQIISKNVQNCVGLFCLFIVTSQDISGRKSAFQETLWNSFSQEDSTVTKGIIYVFSSRPFLPNWLNVSGSNMREISSVALPRVELRWNAFNLGTTH